MDKKIKIVSLTVIMLFLFGNQAFADQLAWLSKENAEKAVKLLKENKSVTLYCGCCSGDLEKDIRITDVRIQKVKGYDYYEVIITYRDPVGDLNSEAVDLAYVWLLKDKKLQTVGEVLGLKHDPCTRLQPEGE